MPRSTLLSTTAVLPSLRNLLTPHAGLLLLRFRMGVMQKSMLNLHSIRCSLRNGHCSSVSFSTSSTRLNTHASPSLSPPSSSNPISISTKETTTTSSLPAKTSSIPLLEQIEPKISLTFTCTVSGCGERSTHQFTRRAYEKGIVLVQCPGCKNRHLIADHVGWFKESTQEGKLCTVEDLLKAKGEKVRRGRLDVGGTVEYIE